jgi:hypothetical protein
MGPRRQCSSVQGNGSEQKQTDVKNMTN